MKMNKKVVIFSSIFAVLLVFFISTVFVFIYIKDIPLTDFAIDKRYILHSPVIYDYNKNILKTFPSPYEAVNGLSRL